MTQRKTTFLIKRSNVPGKVPSAGDLLLGELALNTADVILYTSGTTVNDILPIGWDRVSRTGDTMTGPLIINSDLTVTGNSVLGSFSATSISSSNYYSGTTDLKYILNQTETKEFFIGAEEASTLGSSSRAYIASTGTAFLGFGGATDNNHLAGFNFQVPNDYVSGGTFYILLMTLATTNTMYFQMNIGSINIGGSFGVSTDTAISNVITGSSTNYKLVKSPVYTPVNATFAKNKKIFVRINRLANNASDTYTGDAYVWGIVFEYTGNKIKIS